ncbi:MAG: peptidylprolyl isomerase [Candidatus Magasanikbacteria bacterium]|nr:peptidylprolyl isomerase [Candidatus Magasanikbacteria bacterium]
MSPADFQSEGAAPVIPTQGPEIQNVKRDNQKLFFFGFLGFLALALIVSLAVASYRVYSQAATDSFTTTVARVLRLPALKVNGKAVLYADYVADLKAIGTMRAYDKAHGGSGAALTDEAMSDQVLFRLVNNLLVAAAARQFNLAVEDKDIAGVKSQILSTQFSSLAEADKALAERYGWNLATYEIRVIRPFILQNKLAEKIKSDPEARVKLKTQAQAVFDQVKSGGDFAALARQYGQDGTAAKGGDLGWFGKGEMVPQFEAAVFALKKGDLAPALVESPFGFHIVRLDDRKTEKTKDEKGKTVMKEVVKASHILFAFPTLDQYLNKLVRQADIHLYIKIHDPFKPLRDAVAAAGQGK